MKKLSYESLNVIALKPSEQAVKQPSENLIKTLITQVLPELQAYYSHTQFDWKGGLEIVAKEYAIQLTGCNLTRINITAGLETAKQLSASTKRAPNPIEFKHLCLHSAGMPELSIAMVEISRNRNRFSYAGKSKNWSSNFVYWLSLAVSEARARMADAAWQKHISIEYSKLANKFANNEIKPIPIMIEQKVKPAYMKYGSGTASGDEMLRRIRSRRASL